MYMCEIECYIETIINAKTNLSINDKFFEKLEYF